MTMLKVHIEILNSFRGFEVHVVDPDGRIIKMFRYRTIESARMGAEARAAGGSEASPKC